MIKKRTKPIKEKSNPLYINLSPSQRTFNRKIFFKILESILFPVFIGVLLNLNIIARTLALLWIVVEIVSFFYDPEKLLIELILKFFRIT